MASIQLGCSQLYPRTTLAEQLYTDVYSSLSQIHWTAKPNSCKYRLCKDEGYCWCFDNDRLQVPLLFVLLYEGLVFLHLLLLAVLVLLLRTALEVVVEVPWRETDNVFVLECKCKSCDLDRWFVYRDLQGRDDDVDDVDDVDDDGGAWLLLFVELLLLQVMLLLPDLYQKQW